MYKIYTRPYEKKNHTRWHQGLCFVQTEENETTYNIIHARTWQTIRLHRSTFHRMFTYTQPTNVLRLYILASADKVKFNKLPKNNNMRCETVWIEQIYGLKRKTSLNTLSSDPDEIFITCAGGVVYSSFHSSVRS